MNLLPYIRSHPACATLLAALVLACSVPTTLPAQTDETPPPAGHSETVAPPAPVAPEVEAPATGDAAVGAASDAGTTSEEIQTTPVERVPDTPASEPIDREHIQQLVTIRGNAHLLPHESTPEMVTIMGSAIVDGEVNGNCVTVMGNVTVNGKVRGDLVCVMGQITLGPGAEVRGQIVAVGGALVSDPTARIRGQKVILTLPGIGTGFGGWLGEWLQDGLAKARILPHGHSWAWVVAGVFVLLNLMFAAMFGSAVTASARAVEARPVFAFVNGALVLFLAPVLFTLLAASVVGIPLVPIAVGGLFLCWFIGTIGIYVFCGQQFAAGSRPVVAALVGNLAFLLLYAVPVIGFAVWSVTAVMGLGAAITALGTRRREAREARLAARRAHASQAATATAQQASMAPQMSIAPVVPAAVVPPTPVAAPPPSTSSRFVEATAAPVAPEAAAPVADIAPAPAPGGQSLGGLPLPPPPPAPGVPIPPLPTDPTAERATFWPRLFAIVLDLLVVTVAINVLGIGSFPTWVLAMIGYHVFFWGWRGSTPAGIVGNLQIVRDDGSPMDYKVATVRALSGVFSLIPAGIGFIWVAFDRDAQSWHDKLAGTSVVAVRKARPLI